MGDPTHEEPAYCGLSDGLLRLRTCDVRLDPSVSNRNVQRRLVLQGNDAERSLPRPWRRAKLGHSTRCDYAGTSSIHAIAGFFCRGRWRWSGPSLGQYRVQGLSLSERSVLRQDEARRIHDRGGRQGRWRSSVAWKELFLNRLLTRPLAHVTLGPVGYCTSSVDGRSRHRVSGEYLGCRDRYRIATCRSYGQSSSEQSPAS
jgi:hypothetical protein